MSRVIELKIEVSQAIGKDEFLDGLNRLTENNSSRDLLKAKKIFQLVQDITQMRDSLSLGELIEFIEGRGASSGFVQKFISDYAQIGDGLGSILEQEASQMLVSVFILSEISQLQSRFGIKFKVESRGARPSVLSQKVSDEMNLLKSLVLKVFMIGENAK